MNSINVSLDNLFLDPNNFRLRSNPKYIEVTDATAQKITNKSIQERTKRLLSGRNNIEIKDLIDSFKSNGLLKVDNILVKLLKGTTDKYIVIEGNRRVAALKILKESYENGYDIGKLDREIFGDKGIEVVRYNYRKEEDYLILMALRHVSGNKKWDKYNQAKLIAELSEKGYSNDEIANKIGIASKVIVQQQLDAYYAITDYLGRNDLYDDDPSFNPHEKFMIFLEMLQKRNVRDYLGWNPKNKTFANKSNLDRFYSWISPDVKYDYDDEDKDGEEFEKLPPIIVNHKQIRQLNEIIDDPESLDMLEDTRSIDEALEQNAGYTQKKFTAELQKAEKILRNVKFGASLKIKSDEKQILTNIIQLAQKIQGSK